MAKRFLIKHVGNMGDLVFFLPPVLETLKKKHPDCHITFITAWGLKMRERVGMRNQGGFEINLIMTNPHIDQLIHWHDTKLSLDGNICVEEGQHFPTWNEEYYEQEKASGKYDGVYELDIGVTHDGNPLDEIYAAADLAGEKFSDYKIYLTEQDKRVAAEVMEGEPGPRIVLLEGLDGTSTRGWDPAKARKLEDLIEKEYGIPPRWFGARYIPEHEGRPLTLRENIATLAYCDVGIGVLSGPLHFAVAVGLPTITLYADMPLHRTAPAYFLNDYISDTKKQHRTILGATPSPTTFLKGEKSPAVLTKEEAGKQSWTKWMDPGNQATKAGLAVITPEEVMSVLGEMIS